MQSALHIETSSQGAILVVSLSGMLDGHTCPELEQFTSGDLIPNHDHVVIDLAGLSYVASAGIGIFIGLQQDLRSRGGTVHLVRPSAAVAEVFNLLGLQALFTIHPSLDAAFAAISGGRAS